LGNEQSVKLLQVGDIVRPRRSSRAPRRYAGESDPWEDYGLGVVLDLYEDDYGIVYYEIHWMIEVEWWKENELEIVSGTN
jgi:hypothetical protein